MDILFGTIDAETRRRDVETTLAEEKGIKDHGAEYAEHVDIEGPKA